MRKLYVCVLKFLKVPAVVRAILYIPRVREKNYILETLSVNIHSFHWHVQNAKILCHSQGLVPFLSVMYFFLPHFSTNHSSILSYLILPSISWSTSQSSCSQIHIYRIFSNLIRTSFCRFLKREKSQFAVLIRTFPSTAPCLQGRLSYEWWWRVW